MWDLAYCIMSQISIMFSHIEKKTFMMDLYKVTFFFTTASRWLFGQSAGGLANWKHAVVMSIEGACTLLLPDAIAGFYLHLTWTGVCGIWQSEKKKINSPLYPLHVWKLKKCVLNWFFYALPSHFEYCGVEDSPRVFFCTHLQSLREYHVTQWR